jgi:tape measure domain-containing protein
MANSIGSAQLKIVPSFDGLTSQVNNALSSASTSASSSGSKLGQSTASGFGKGLVSSGAVIGAFSSITSKAMSSISSHVDSAVSRFDTLNNYPKVMQSLGYSATDAQSSISKMSDRLSNLPTTLDSMTSTVQGIVAVTGDLSQATDAGLALNDMLIASGSNTQLTSAAMEQFRQILSKGKPDMQDWKSLTAAMPGQMNQLAESMLGAGATASDLYTALGGGGAEATVSMDELLNAMIKLDTEGSGSITSFKEQAETAAGGISTSVSNLSNAVTKGITGVLDTIGKDNIASVFTDMKSAVNDAFSVVKSAVSAALPTVKSFYDVFKSNSGTITAGVATFAGLTAVTGTVSNAFSGLIQSNKNAANGFGTLKSGATGALDTIRLVASGAGSLSDGLSALKGDLSNMGSGIKGVFSGLVSAIDPAAVAITAVTAAISLGVAAYTDWKTKAETATKATSGLNDAVSRTAALSSYSGTLDNVGASSGTAAKSLDDLRSSIAKSVDTMNSTTEAAETNIATLNTAQRIIDEYAGKTDLSTEAQGKLQWAIQKVNDTFGTSYTATDIANDAYDENGEHVDNLKQKIDELITSKKQELATQAITSNLTEAYKNQSEAAKTLAEKQSGYDAVLAKHDEIIKNYTDAGRDAADGEADFQARVATSKKALDDAQSTYDSCTESVHKLETSYANASTASSDYGTTLNALTNDQLPAVEGALDNSGQSISEFGATLDALGVNTEQLNSKSATELTSLANCYDGSAASIVGKLEEMGVAMDESAVSMAENCASLKETLNGDEGFKGAVEATGATMNDFAYALAEAGVSTETLNSIGSANFATLAANCGYNTDQMVWAISNYNNIPIVEKDGTVTINDAQLKDAENNVYTWNGETLVDKEGNAAANDTELKDAQNNIYIWNGSELAPKTAQINEQGSSEVVSAAGSVKDALNEIPEATTPTVNLNDNASGSISSISAQLSSLNGQTATTHVYNYTHNITENTTTSSSGHASGGIRPHASGGIVPRYHAHGAIATKAVPLDIVGEAGAEAIVPLTNKKYTKPFAATVAKQMDENGSNAAVVSAIAALSEAVRNMEAAVYVDGKKLASTIAKPMNQQLGVLAARGC